MGHSATALDLDLDFSGSIYTLPGEIMKPKKGHLGSMKFTFFCFDKQLTF